MTNSQFRPDRLQPLAVQRTFRPLVSVVDVLGLPGFCKAQVVAGEGGLNRPVERVNVIQIPTNRYVKKNQLVLAPATVFRDFGGDSAELLTHIADRGVSAIGVRGAPLPALLSASALREAHKRGLPLIELGANSHLGELQTEVLDFIVNTRTKQLKWARQLRSQLADHILSGGGLEAIPREIAPIVGGDVVIVGRDGEILAASAGADERTAQQIGLGWIAQRDWNPAEADDDWIVVPILGAATRPLGCLLARLDSRDPLQWAALQQGATLAALQILHHQAAADAAARLRAGFIQDLVTGALDSDAARRRARAIGWEPDTQSYQILAVAGEAGDGPRVVQEVVRVAPSALFSKHLQTCLVICPIAPLAETTSPSTPGQVDAKSHISAAELAITLSDLSPSVHAGISAQHVGLDLLQIAVAEARIALRAAQMFDRRTRIRRVEDLGVLRFLVEVPKEELSDFASYVLAPLDEVAEHHRCPLLSTLELMVQSNLNLAETARRGGWHYNTVRSRVQRLRELLGPFTHSGPLFGSICLALLLRKELSQWRPAHSVTASNDPARPTDRSGSVSPRRSSRAGSVSQVITIDRTTKQAAKSRRIRTSIRKRDAVHSFTVADILRMPCLHDAQLVAGEAGLQRLVETAGVLDVTDPSGTRPNQFVLTNAYAILKLDLPELIRYLVSQGMSALGVKLSTYWRELPPTLVREADATALPTLILPEGPFDEIVNPVLTSIAGSQLETLRRSERVHEDLTQAGLQAAGEPSAITRILTDALNRPSAVFNGEAELLATTGATKLWRHEKLKARLRSAVASGTITVGDVDYLLASARIDRSTRATVAVAEVDGSDSLARGAVAHAAAVAAMLLIGRQQVERVYRRYERELLEELVDGRLLGAEEARSRAAALGWPVDHPYVVFMAAPAHGSYRTMGTQPTWLDEDELASLSRSLRKLGCAMRPLPRPQGLGFVLHLTPGENPAAVAQTLSTQLDAQHDLPGRHWIVGASRARNHVIELAEAFREAGLALLFAPWATKISHRIVHFTDLGAFRLLSQARDLRTIREGCCAVLRDIGEGSAHHRELIHTLEVLLNHNMNLRSATSELHFHYNTVRHRNSRLRRILGDALDSWEGRLTVAFAVAGIRLLERLSLEGRLQDDEGLAHPLPEGLGRRVASSPRKVDGP